MGFNVDETRRAGRSKRPAPLPKTEKIADCGLLNILTRTSNRPNRFKRLRESILAQKCNIKLRHYVSIDRPCDYLEGVDVIVPAYGKGGPAVPHNQKSYRDAPYNLYINDLLDAVDDGWILILDDDDELLVENAIAKIEPYLTDTENLVICRFALGRSILPKYWGKRLQLNDVACSSVIYHSKHKELAKWHEKYSGDFYAASNLEKKLKSVWVNEVIAGTQRGPSEGRVGSIGYKPWEPREISVPVDLRCNLLSIIIPVMNQIEYTKAAIKNIREMTHIPYEIIVIDNGSTDSTPEFLNNQNDVMFIRNERNAGMSKSWNQGCQAAKGDYLAILNNDLLLPDGWAETLTAHKEHAVCPCYRQGEDIIPGFIGHNRTLKDSQLRMRPADPPGIPPRGFAGFCFLLSREAWETVGPFDEKFFYWFGDTDYYEWLEGMGFRCMQSLNVQIHHYLGKTLRTRNDFREVKAKDFEAFKKKYSKRYLEYEGKYPQWSR